MSMSYSPDAPMWPFFSRPSAPATLGEEAFTSLATESLREDVAAVIYERFFPQLIWGDATRSGQASAYASADAILEILQARGLLRTR